MKGLWLEHQRLTLRDDLPEPVPQEDEVRIRLIEAGICSTDHHLTRGLYPFAGVLGHEFVGRVDRGPSEWLGKRVVGEINLACHRCATCRAGRGKHCPSRTVLGIVGRDGAFAEYLCLPVCNLHAVPDSITDRQAAFVEPLAAALEIQQQVTLTPSDRVLVIGDGKLGQLVARTIAAQGCALHVIGRHETKLAPLRALGATTSTEAVAEPGSFDYAVEVTGNADGFAIARSALRPAGTLILKSTYRGAVEVDMTPLVVDEIRVVGSRCGRFDRAIEWLEQGRVDPTDLAVATYPLPQAVEAFEHSRRPGVLKVMLAGPA